MSLKTPRLPKRLYSLFGEYIVLFNTIDFKFKNFLSALVEDDSIGHILTASQSFDYVRKRINVLFNEIIENPDLKNRWNDLQPEIQKLSEIRNDIAHAYIDFDNVEKDKFLITRFSETKALKLSARQELYYTKDIENFIIQLKKINKQVSFLFHSTYKEYMDIIYYSGKGMMF